MIEILENILSILTGDATLTAMVPAANIFTGPVEIVQEAQSDLKYPQINLSIVSESTRSVPNNSRDTMVQLSIFSNTSMIEAVNIYERVLTLLEYSMTTIDTTAIIWWLKISGMQDQFESDRRIWHRAVTLVCWSQKPLPNH